jgi:hypothetical protein
MIVLVFLGRSLNCTLLIFSVFGIFFGIIAGIYYLRPSPRLFVAKSAIEENAQLTKAGKFVALTKDKMLEQNN